MIEVVRKAGDDPLTFEVRVREDDGESRHHVTMRAADLARLAPGSTAERCIEAAFRFLLDRESRRSILHRFDFAVIARYFPEFERELPRYLANAAGAGAP